ncbi:molecular chaperone DnaK [Pseudoalteromonas sp. SR44-5]|uniref:molecular chaperone DnaK n=1 Tax=Pseudoalteromonas sp. SR44-5 TaxID=2760934 RepID=UPI00160441D7|nr:molecular chaperone DnaK [Pseudoalteromonas sp. SR44-5]MBB1365415.1 molecular chaperone DnaK [Pseudoalteromonas sp. SR44-5]
MDTERITQWNLSNKEAQQFGIDACFDKMVIGLDETIQREIVSFVNDLTVTSQSTPLVNALNHCFNDVKSEFNAARWVSFEGEIYFDKHAKGFWMLSIDKINSFKNDNKPKSDIYSGITVTSMDDKAFESGTLNDDIIEIINSVLQDEFNEWGIPDRNTLRQLTNLSTAPFDICDGHFFLTDSYLYNLKGKAQAFNCARHQMANTTYGYCLPYSPQLDISELGNKGLFINAIYSGFVPEKIKDNELYKALVVALNYKNKAAIKGLEDKTEILNQLITQKITSTLLLEDYIRADIAPYHSKMLEDTDLGHWSLWTDELENTHEQSIHLPIPMVARDPKSSINDGVVAIDFGTKSTVVVYQKDNVNIHPMRVGTGDLRKDIKAYHYENPTIMEFNDLEQFIHDYQAKDNKPYTRWQDLTISHTAQNAMHGCDSSHFNTFLGEIKQWAGDKNRKLKIVGKEGKVIDLPAFLEIGENDFNPIEIYAYYLGLYINNQNNGIYLDYILSFPVTYEMPIRDKIIESFEKGIQKSLPAELGEEQLDQLTVTKGASEPAAYALVALLAFDFDPCDDERVFYSVFDFGGGTTDFDFGIFREANGKKERRFDYVIEHFGAGGDRFLGGENLLELLAFEIFKKNQTALLAKGIQFEKHPEKDFFAGSEQLLSTSQEAKINTKTLCEMLRPFWQGESETCLDLSQGSLSINLTDVNSVVHTAFELDVSEDELNTILYERIERGVVNFFNALRLAFSHSKLPLQDIDSIKIFLAGNSSKSHFVREIFDKQITLQHEEMQHAADENSRFELYAPLGAEIDDVEKPTGKTGVAFGLIESREGGRIKVIDHNITEDEIRFKYYLGESRKNQFKAIVDREIKFNQWFEFIDASVAKFEVFYTEQPRASTGKMSINDSAVKKVGKKLDVTDDDAMVYLRVISPTQIEYVVAYEDAIANDDYLNEIQLIELM